MDEKLVTRRNILASMAAVPLFGLVRSGNQASYYPEEEYEIRFTVSGYSMLVQVWSGGQITVHCGPYRLRLVKIEKNGWRTYRGRGRTGIRCRHRKNTLDIDWVVIVEPR